MRSNYILWVNYLGPTASAALPMKRWTRSLLTASVRRRRSSLCGRFAARTPTVVIGKDTRISSDMLEGALIAGSDSLRLRRDAARRDPDAGGRISDGLSGMRTRASSSPPRTIRIEHNGIKMFSPEGFKLSDALEARHRGADSLQRRRAACQDARRDRRRSTSAQRRGASTISTIWPRPSRRLSSGLRVLIDCANGAASDHGAVAVRPLPAGGRCI